MTDRGKALSVLVANTAAFTVCFACWMTNGVLVTWLVDNGILRLDKAQMGWLIGIPVLTGSLMRLPVGVLTDKYGGRIVYGLLMLLSAVPMYMLSWCNTYPQFLLASLGFGLTGASFAVGIAYTSVWFPRAQQGTALGIFGVGNAGAALTSMGAPFLLRWLTGAGANLDQWRIMPRIYAGALVVTAVLFFLATHHRVVEHGVGKTLRQRLEPLRHMRVWRFGLYYFLVFGGFVALAQWLIPYYVNVYAMPVTVAGLMAAIFTLPSGVIRALGGWLSDRRGAREVMYWVLGTCLVGCALLMVPRMVVESPGQGVMAAGAGTVTRVSDGEIVVGATAYALKAQPTDPAPWEDDKKMVVLPKRRFWQVPIVEPGQTVAKRQLLARGVTRIYFQANVWIFTALVFVVGIAMGIGKAAVYKHIPDYFPEDVGVVGGMVGVLGGLGGFFCPIVFGYILKWTGIWTTCWIFLAVLSALCLVWMHLVIRRLMHKKVPELMRTVETVHEPAAARI